MLFSLRHRTGLQRKLISPTLPRNLRRSIVRALAEHATPEHDDWGNVAGYKEFGKAELVVLRDTGKDRLYYYHQQDEMTPGSFEQVVEHGLPCDAMDLVEACIAAIPVERRSQAEAALNGHLSTHGSPWRLANGQFMLVDSRYLEEEVLQPATDLLHSVGFEGPLREFSDARLAVADGRNRDAVVAANNALESTIKGLLGIEREKPGRLIARLIQSGKVPDYYSGFLDSLDKILYTVLTERSEPGRAHGSGKQAQDVPRACAQFIIHLVATLIVFLLRHDAESGAALPEEPPDPWSDT